MTSQIEDQALSLPRESRARLARRLFKSLHDETDEKKSTTRWANELDESLAAKISDLMLKQGAELDAVLVRLHDEGREETVEVLRDPFSKLLTSILMDVWNPLYAAHPDLKPPELD